MKNKEIFCPYHVKNRILDCLVTQGEKKMKNYWASIESLPLHENNCKTNHQFASHFPSDHLQTTQRS